jgi:hypothetical protein
MNRRDKCEAILEKILELVNQGRRVAFEEDWGGNSLTLFIDGAHTHCGVKGNSWNDLINSLHSTLSGGPGLSFHDPDGDLRKKES